MILVANIQNKIFTIIIKLMDIEQKQQALPVHAFKQQIIEKVLHNKVTIISGQTGSGKTTQIPQFLLEHFQKILISQPRRISAISLAERVSFQLGQQVGNTIGYSVRFQQKRSYEKQKVTFVTDGMAIRQMMIGRKYSLYIVDQAHERSINTDVLLAILKGLVKNSTNETKYKKKQDFKIVIMSATIDIIKFCQFFNTDSVVKISGRSYPTQIYNLLNPTSDYMGCMLNTILQIHDKQAQGDILAFLTGEEQILEMRNQLNSFLMNQRDLTRQKNQQSIKILPEFQVLILFSALPHEYHMQIFRSKEQICPLRRIILATNIAQTSITIPGVRFVIDCGFMKVRLFDVQTKIQILSAVPISKANAEQRAGRAGRQAPGKCYRLYIQNDYEQLPEQMLPEILRSQLSAPFLQLKVIGVPSLRKLQFVDQPNQTTFARSLELLFQLGLIQKESEKITEKGIQLSKLPLEPLMSNLLVSSIDLDCEQWMLSLVSLHNVDNLYSAHFGPTTQIDYSSNRQNKYQKLAGILKKFNVNKILSDHLTKINLLHQYILTNNKKSFCKQNMVNSKSIKKVAQIRQQLKDYLQQIKNQRSKKSFFSITDKKTSVINKLMPLNNCTQKELKSFLKCFEQGSIYNIAKLQKSGKYMISKTSQQAYIHPESLCFNSKNKPNTIIFSQLIKTTKLYMRNITMLQ